LRTRFSAGAAEKPSAADTPQLTQKMHHTTPPHRNATPILCLTLAEKEEDFSKRAAHGQKDAHRRRLETSNANFFRCKVSTALLHPDDVIPKYVFGVTQQGASCNNTGVNGRNMWHSEQRCVEQLCRVRGPADFISVMRSAFTDCNGGAHNMANVYVMKMYGYKLDELAKGGEKDFNERYEKVKRNREAKAKAEALSAKIEAGKLLLEKKQAAVSERSERSERALKNEKYMRADAKTNPLSHSITFVCRRSWSSWSGRRA